MPLFSKGHWTYPIIHQRCPACHEGDFFVHRHGYRTKEIGKIHDKCPKCGQRYSPEPGFYFGAAYVSYALNVALMVSVAVALNVLMEEDPEPHHYLIGIIGLTLLLLPGIFRLSRIIWATMFIPYGGEKKQF
ncbi:MAG: DUF983 domain-containing protein [Flavobacteriales bacterium]|nr:DUF983 domain-containing protein [Flavobacteriales bacterium]